MNKLAHFGVGDVKPCLHGRGVVEAETVDGQSQYFEKIPVEIDGIAVTELVEMGAHGHDDGQHGQQGVSHAESQQLSGSIIVVAHD